MIKQFISSLFVLASASAYSQKMDSLLDIQRKADPQEKIYVQFDKTYYNPGETIWFKAYLFTGIDPSERSKNFYAELLDEQGNVLSQKTAPVIFSGAAGSFDLDSNLNKKILYFRAYTLAILNSDTSFIYTKALRIITTKTTTSKLTMPVTSIRFLPESGSYTASLACTIAFIATNQQGLPVTVSGTVTDNTGIKVAEFKTLHDGMGKFFITPEEGKTYTAVWKDEAGKQYTNLLPVAKSQGISFKLTDDGENKRFTIYRTQGASENMKTLRLTGYVNQHTAFEATVNLTNKLAATGVLPVKNFPSGILQITIFDSNNKPLAERLTFVNNHDYEFDGDAFLTQKNYTRRGLNQLEITMSDTSTASLSLAVTDADLNESSGMEDNIISHLLLTGELKGKVINPYYYFFSTDDSAAIYLDLVMMTHGWRRYNWDDVFAGKTIAPKWKESNYLNLNGQVAGLVPGSFSPDLQLVGILQTADSAKSFISLPVDRTGKIAADRFIFYDKAKLFFNFNKKNLSFDKSMLILDNGLRKGYNKAMADTSAKIGLADITPAIVTNNIKVNKTALQSNKLLARSNMMENITVKAKAKTTKEKMEEKYVSGLFSGDGSTFDLVNDPLASSYQDIFQYLQGKVAGLQITAGGATPTLSWRGGTPALYLNEMQTDVDMVSGTPVSDIAYIKILRPGESIVSGGGGGVIAIYTRKGGDAQPNPNSKGLSYVQLTGYSAVKEFYSPDYATPSEKDAYDDVRTTLYWNPSIYLDKNRKRIRLKFYNNDITKRFRLVMEGINADGKLIHVEKEVGSQ